MVKINLHCQFGFLTPVSKGNITDAKASVVAATNAQKLADEASEALESARQEYLPLIMAFTQVEYP